MSGEIEGQLIFDLERAETEISLDTAIIVFSLNGKQVSCRLISKDS